MTRIQSQTTGRLVTRSVCTTPKTIIIEDTETPSLNLEDVTLFKTLKDLLDDGIKPVLEAKFTTIRNMFTQEMKSIISKRLLISSNIQEEARNRNIDQIREDNAWLWTEVVDITREVRSTVAAKSSPPRSPPQRLQPLSP